jgi:rhomboid family GlyGly-CTERM serine protease
MLCGIGRQVSGRRVIDRCATERFQPNVKRADHSKRRGPPWPHADIALPIGMPESDRTMNVVHDSTTTNALQRRQPWTVQGGANVWLTVSIALTCMLLALCGERVALALRYDRAAIIQGHEYWRLLTGHLLHANTRHLLLNLAGLGLIASLCRACYTFGQWLWVSMLVLIAIDAGFLLRMPDLGWYVGLSGALHGVLAAGAVRWWRIESLWLAAALSSILLAKLSWEQWQGALPLAGNINVVVNAHLYGAVGGLVGGLCVDWYLRRLSGRQVVT